MKKLAGLVLLCILSAIVASAATQVAQTLTQGNLDVGSSVILGGKNMTIISATPDFIRVTVDGVKGTVPIVGDLVDVNGMRINVTNASNYVFFDSHQIRVELYMVVIDTCGDGNCSGTEDSMSCCKDCGCSSGYACVGNVCLKEFCSLDSECDDKNPCTKDACVGTPKKCTNHAITVCLRNDNCCPENCSYPADTDCIKQCSQDAECDDGNACTDDICKNGVCSIIPKGCEVNGTCVLLGGIKEKMYCSTEGMQSQKNLNVPCKQAYECLSGNCENGACRENKAAEAVQEAPKAAEAKKPLPIGIIIGAAVMVIIIGVGYLIMRNRSADDEHKPQDGEHKEEA